MLLLYPLGIISTKSALSASQTVLHTLFLPHPIKSITTNSDPAVLKGGQLYRDNRPVTLPAGAQENLVEREDVGRAVWEYFEAGLQKWEEEEKAQLEKAKAADEGDKGKGRAQGTVSSANRPSSKDDQQ